MALPATNKIDGKFRYPPSPPPPPQNKKQQQKWGLLAFALLSGDVGLLFHFILSTIVGALRLSLFPQNILLQLKKIIGLSGAQLVLKSYKEFEHFTHWFPCGASIDRGIAMSNF